MTVIEVVRQAAEAVKSTDREDVVTWLLMHGYNISPVIDVFRAIDTIETGRKYDSNKRIVKPKMWADYTNYREHNKATREKQSTYVKDRYYKLRDEGLCAICGKTRVLLDRALCRSCLDTQALHKKRHYLRGAK